MTVAKEDRERERKGGSNTLYNENVSTQIIIFCKLFGGPLAMPSHRLGTAGLVISYNFTKLYLSVRF